MEKPKRFSRPEVSGANKFSKPSPYKTVSWTEYRAKFLRINNRCYVCGHRSTVVDHVKAHKGNEELFWKLDNFIPLCKIDHDYVTGKFDQFVIPKTEEKLKWLMNERLKNDITFTVKVVPI